MNMLEVLCDKHLQNILITQEFKDYRDDLAAKLDRDGRDETEMLLHTQCVIAEYELQRLGLVTSPSDYSHDIVVDGRRIDIKVVSGDYFNVRNDKKRLWYQHCVDYNKVDDFAFLRYKRKVISPLEVGETISLQFIKQLPAKEVLYKLRRSNYNGGKGYFYTV